MDGERSPYAMHRVPPSTQMREALTHDLHTGVQGHRLKRFARRTAELLLQTAWRQR